ncbi:MAG: hypothetical protein ACYS0K_24665 [Planctomycetota bacterium]|jgi:hypothetical protein
MEFALDQEVYDEEGLVDEDVAERYADELIERFAASPEGAEVIAAGGALAWAHAAIELGIRYADVNIADMTRLELEQLLFDTFPRKISCAPEDAPAIVGVLHAFWRFVERAFDAPFAAGCLALLESPGVVEEVRRALADPGNWGFAKSFFMGGQAAGHDMTTQEGPEASRHAYNEALRDPAAHREADVGVRQRLGDDRNARRRKRKAQKRSRRRNR